MLAASRRQLPSSLYAEMKTVACVSRRAAEKRYQHILLLVSLTCATVPVPQRVMSASVQLCLSVMASLHCNTMAVYALCGMSANACVWLRRSMKAASKTLQHRRLLRKSCDEKAMWLSKPVCENAWREEGK